VADCCCTPVPPSNGSRPKSPRRRGGRWSEGGPSKTDGYGEASITVGMASNPPTRLTRVAVATPDIGGLPPDGAGVDAAAMMHRERFQA